MSSCFGSQRTNNAAQSAARETGRNLSKGLVASDALTASSAFSASRVWIWSSRRPTSLLRVASLWAQRGSPAYTVYTIRMRNTHSLHQSESPHKVYNNQNITQSDYRVHNNQNTTQSDHRVHNNQNTECATIRTPHKVYTSQASMGEQGVTTMVGDSSSLFEHS